jgi:hypothetical protein
MDPRTKIILDVASTAAHYAIKQVRKARDSKKLISTKNLDKARIIADSCLTVLSAFSDDPGASPGARRLSVSSASDTVSYDLMEKDAAGNFVPTKEMFQQLKKLQAQVAMTEDVTKRTKLLKKINAIYALVLDDTDDEGEE